MTNPYSETIPHQQCHAPTKSRVRCTRRALPDHVYCKQHALIGRAELVVQGYCQAGVGNLWTNGSQPYALFHYTSVKALQSILETNCLWLSRSDHMNDEIELVYGAEILLRLLAKKRGRHIKELQGLVEAMRDNFLPVFVFSTALGENSLAHWNAFPNNDGDGVCIEFSLNQLSSLAHDAFHSVKVSHDSYRPVFYHDIFQQRVGGVVYDLNLQEHYVNKAIDTCITHLDEESLPIGVRWLSVREFFITLMLFLKSPEFYMETEYRLCFIGKEDHPDYNEVVKSRETNWTNSLPYLELPLNSKNGLPFSAIMASPRMTNWDTHVSKIKGSLSSLGVPEDSVSFRTSGTKLRC